MNGRDRELDQAFGQGCILGILLILVVDLILILLVSKFLETLLEELARP